MPDPSPKRNLSTIGTLQNGHLAVYATEIEGGVYLTDASNVSAVMLPGLPTADPHVVGQLWSNSGVLTVSAG